MTDATDAPVPTWVRLVLIIPLAIPQLVIGVWAIVAPRSWYDTFPGFDPHLVAAEPPFNQHLATDVGAGFLATGIALVVAAALARRSGAYVALAAYASFSIVHFGYHVTHQAATLTTRENVLNLALLGSGLIWLALAAWGARPQPRPTPTDPTVGL